MPFSGPDGQGPFDDHDDCTDTMDGKVEDPDALCAKWMRQDKEENMTVTKLQCVEDLDDEILQRLSFESPPRSQALLAEFKEGDVVDIEGRESSGVITGVMTENFEFPTGVDDEGETETREVEASSDEPVYIVAPERGAVLAVSGDNLSEGSLDVETGDDEEDVKELANETEAAPVYAYMDDPGGSVEELREAKKAYIMDHYAAELSDSGIEEPEAVSYEELLNIPGVDDPEVGFDELPEGWTRKSVLQAWASLGGTFRTCRADMVGEIRSPTRWCAALKDEVLRTELWRNRF